MAKILIVTSEFSPFQSSGINRLSFFKRYLQEQGNEVFILTTYSTSQGLSSDKTYNKSNNIHRSFSLNLFTRRVLSSRRLPIYPKIAKSGKYTEWVPFAVSKGLKIIKDERIDVVLTSFPDFSSIDVAEQIAKKSNTKLITDFRDPPHWIYDQVTMSRKVLKCQSIIEKAIKTSKHIITCTNESANSLKKYYKTSTDITVIANGYDLDIINQIEANNKDTNKQYFEIVHIGSFYDEGRDMKRIIDALREQSKITDKNIHLRLIGDEPDSDTKKYIQKESDKIKVSIESPIPMFDALSIAKKSDALLLLQGSRFNRQIPTKAYEYIALNTIIWAVVGSQGATKALLQDNPNNIIYADYDNQDSINLSLSKLFNAEASATNTEKLSRQAQASKLLNIINN